MPNNEHRENPNRVFVSCRRDSGESVANKFVELLKEYGYRAARDRESYSSEHLNNDILPRIGRCDYFVLVLTKNALNRCNNDNDELLLQIQAALKKNKPLVTIKDTSVNFPNDLPKSLKSLNNYPIVTVDMNKPKDFDNAVTKICNHWENAVIEDTSQPKKFSGFDNKKNSLQAETSTKSRKWLLLPLVLIIIGISTFMLWQSEQSSEPPIAAEEPKESNSRPPVVEEKPKVSNSQPPVVEEKPKVSNSRPPVVEEKPKVSNSRPPIVEEPEKTVPSDYRSKFEVPNFRRVAGSNVEHSSDLSWNAYRYPGKEEYYSGRNETYAYECSVDDKEKFAFAGKFAKMLVNDGLFKLTDHYKKDDDIKNKVYEGWIFEYIGPKERIENFKVVNPDSKDPYEAHVVVRCDRDYRNERKAIFVITVAKNLKYEDESSMKKSMRN